MEKQEGIINGIIYDYLVYANGKYRDFPTITRLKRIIELISESKATTEYISIKPFYVNERIDRQIEFDDFTFYIECRDQFDDTDLKAFIESCVGKKFTEMNSEELTDAHVQYRLCKHGDIATFNDALAAYVQFLNVQLPKLLEISNGMMALLEEDLAFGFFRFEVFSD